MLVRSLVAVLAFAGFAIAEQPRPPLPRYPSVPFRDGGLMCSSPCNETMIRAEVTIVRLHPETMKALELWQPCDQPGQKCLLTACQVRKVLDQIKADDRCEILSSPQVVALDGQRAVISISSAEGEGFECALMPRISLDHKFVQMAISSEHREAMHKDCEGRCPGDDDSITLKESMIKLFQMDTIVTVPKGQSVMIETCRPQSTNRYVYQAGSFFNVNVVASCERHVCVIVTPSEMDSQACASPMPLMVDCGGQCQVAVSAPPIMAYPCPVTHAIAFVPAQECEEPRRPANPTLTKLMAKYEQACADGDTEKARKLARRCLDIDPTCFTKER